jgi:AcrR family transcriptional regulator
MTEMGLRERSKVRRRRAIQLAAMRLFAERGYDATTVTEIAEAAEVAPRTVSLYFPSKLDIALASTADATERLVEALDEHPTGASIVETLGAWLQNEARTVGEEEWGLRVRMYAANPMLASVALKQTDALTELSGRILAEEIGVATDHPAVRFLIGALAGVLQQHQLTSHNPQPDREAEEQVIATIGALLSGAIEGVKDHLVLMQPPAT